MENRFQIARDEVAGGEDVTQRDSIREFLCGDGSFLNPEHDSGYTNVYMQ